MENICAVLVLFFIVTQWLTFCKTQCTDYFILLEETDTGLTPLANNKILDWRRTADFNETTCLLEFDCPEHGTESYCTYYTNFSTTESTEFEVTNKINEESFTETEGTSFLPKEIIEKHPKIKPECKDYFILLEETDTGLIPLAKNEILHWIRTADFDETTCLLEFDCPEEGTESYCTSYTNFSTTEFTDVETTSAHTNLVPVVENVKTSYFPIQINDEHTTIEFTDVETKSISKDTNLVPVIEIVTMSYFPTDINDKHTTTELTDDETTSIDTNLVPVVEIVTMSYFPTDINDEHTTTEFTDDETTSIDTNLVPVVEIVTISYFPTDIIDKHTTTEFTYDETTSIDTNLVPVVEIVTMSYFPTDINDEHTTTEFTDVETTSIDTNLVPVLEIVATSYYPTEISDENTATSSLEVETTTRDTNVNVFGAAETTSFKDNKNKVEIIILAGVGSVALTTLLYIVARTINDSRLSRDYFLPEP